MEADIVKLQTRAARHPSNHVQRFVPLIETVINAMKHVGLRLEQRYENQIKINDRWIGRYEHGNAIAGISSRLTIYDLCDGQPPSPRQRQEHWSSHPIIEIHNAAEAEVFARTLKWASEMID